MKNPQRSARGFQLAFKFGLIIVFIATMGLLFFSSLSDPAQNGPDKKTNTGAKLEKPLADCPPLNVTSPMDDLATCGTLRYALNYLANNPAALDKTVDLSSLAPDTVLQVSGSSLVVPVGANLQAPCVSALILDGSALAGDGIVLSGQNKISGLKIGGFGQRQVSFNYPDPSAARTVTFSCSQIKAGGAAELIPVQGLPQSSTVATAFPSPIQVKFQRWYGQALTGITVTFSLIAGTNGANATFAGGFSSVDSLTDNSGVATAPGLTANTTAGDFTLQVAATLVGSPTTTRSFVLTNLAGSPTSLVISGGQSQSVTVNTSFPQALKVTLTDSFGNLVPGIGVTFSAPAGGGQATGTFSNNQNQLTVNTSSLGVASASLKANTVAGGFTVSASYNALSATFNLTNLAGPPATLTALAGSGQSARTGNQFSIPFQARVSDAYGNVLSGITVNFNAPASGASGSFNGGNNNTSAITNGSGIATAPSFSANSLKGNYLVTASTGGTAATASFSLTNLGPTTIIAVAGSGQSTNVGTTYPLAFQAKVTDQNGNPLSGIQVNFNAPGSGASGSFGGSNSSSGFTDFSGVATAPAFSANQVGGSYNVSASTAGVATSAFFSLTNTVGPTTVSASVSNPSPARYTVVTVYGQLIVRGLPAVGATMTTTWHYKTTTVGCSDTTDNSGQASCSRGIGNATVGYRVVIEVIFTYNGQTYSTSTSFTPSS